MHIVRLTLACPPGKIASKADADLICDALWAHSGPEGEIAHITTTAVPDGIDVAIFLNSGTDDPDHRVEALLRSIPKLPGTPVPRKTEEV
jgi:hypothetical protein